MSTGTGNTRGGKNYKKKKTRRIKAQHKGVELDVENGEGCYGVVKRICGGSTVEVLCSDGTMCQGRIPGRMMNKIWLKKDDKILMTPEKEVVKIIRDTDKEVRDFAEKMRESGHSGIFGQNDDDDIELDEHEGNVNRPSKQTMKERTIKRMTARDTESFTDSVILQRQVENMTLGTDSSDESDDDESTTTKNTKTNKDAFGNDLEESDEEEKSKGKKGKDKKSKSNDTPGEKLDSKASKQDEVSEESVDIDDI